MTRDKLTTINKNKFAFLPPPESDSAGAGHEMGHALFDMLSVPLWGRPVGIVASTK